MTTDNKLPPYENNKMQLLEEICENTRAIRRVSNRILDHLHEYQTGIESSGQTAYDSDDLDWDALDDYDDMYM